MGINGLFAHLSPLLRPINLKNAVGLTVAIDGHVWLHRAAFVDAVASSGGRVTLAHVRYFSNRAKLLMNLGIKPLIVFDGNELPAKSLIDDGRYQRRSASLARAIGLRDCGNMRSADDHFAQSADVSHDFVHEIVNALRSEGFHAHVAPYEADAQLTFLARSGIADFVISEDTDLAVYGCPRVVFKFDPIACTGIELAYQFNNAPIFQGLSERDSTLACVLAGCDYGPRIKGVGLKRAVNLVKECEGDSGRMHKYIVNKHYDVASETVFREHLRIAQLVFHHQTVFDPLLKRLRPIRDHCKPRFNGDTQRLLGDFFEDHIAELVYEGRAHPVSKVLRRESPEIKIIRQINTGISS
jgi:exonuclease-1